ncbi:MAG: hypothetical protein LBK99_04020 [Opitutaceae bacterium]|nr:hypothetical protein [Opitutaceae bacterium]
MAMTSVLKKIWPATGDFRKNPPSPPPFRASVTAFSLPWRCHGEKWTKLRSVPDENHKMDIEYQSSALHRADAMPGKV